MRTALLSLSLVAATPPARAQAPAKTGDVKIAYVDLSRAVDEIDEFKNAKGRLKSEFDKKQKQLDKMQLDFKAKQEDFEKRQAMMKDDARQARIQELQKERAELLQTYESLQRELMEEQSKAFQQIESRLKNIVTKIGDRDGYTLILNVAGTVLYYKRHQEITDDVVVEYNKQYAAKK